MKQDLIKLSAALLTVATLVGCGGGSSDVNRVITPPPSAPDNGDNGIHKLEPQSGTQSKLFYGNSKHDALGSLSNVQVIDVSGSKGVSRDSLDARYPVVTTALTYDANGNYSDLHTQSISYVSDSKPYTVSMAKESGIETENSSAGTLDDFDYQKISYLGAKQYLAVTDANGSQLLITPEMGATDAPLAFDHKTLEAVTYQSFGGAVDGYIVIHDADDDKSTTNELQKCNLDISTCTKIADINDITKYSHGRPYSAYDMTLLGDISGTAESIYLSENKIFNLNKANGTVTEMGTISADSFEHSLKGSEIFYLENDNVYKSTLNGTVTQISTDGKAADIRAYSDDMVMYGGDDYMYAVAKDGSLKDDAIEISFTTKTRGQKYPFDLGIGKQYLYTTYSVDTTTGKTTYSACKLEDGKKECRENSYWSAVTAAKNGTLNSTSTYAYAPYAYVRVDNAAGDNYGGGNVKAIDPKYPLEEGITMGSIKTFNFQTFVNSSYDNDMIDSEGNIVLYAKNDLDFRGDAFSMNLTKENTLVNLTKEASPEVDGAINAGRDHCHGRKCTVCHSFAGGKIYEDKEGSASAKNHTIRFEFEDGSDSILAKVRKGSGENFNTPLENLVGKNFKAVVVDENETAVVSSVGFYHQGVEYFNCNYCHGRNGDLKYDAPNVITIEP